MAYKTGRRMQSKFLPPVIEDYVKTNAPVRVYDAFVDALNFHELGISLEPSAHGGADEYYPKTMLKLLIYGYSYGIRSSRKLERACYDNLSFIWLTGDLKPDYRTISRFRSEYKDALRKVLKQCVRVCAKLDLIEGNVLFVDGSKFRANASINNAWSKERCEEYLKKIESQVDELIDQTEQIDKQEENEQALIQLKKQIYKKEQMVDKIKGVLTSLSAEKKDNINSTDADCIKAKNRQGTHAVYNVQNTVDGKHGLIIHTEAVSQSNDYNQLSRQVEASCAVLEKEPEHVCTDAGYASVDDLIKISPKINIIVPSHKQAQEENKRCPVKLFDKEHFSYNEQLDEYNCPCGKKLKFKDIPEPNKKRYQADGAECRACPHFGDPKKNNCTQSHNGRYITRLNNERFKEQLEVNYKRPENQEIYKLRKQTVEHPFGHMKRNLGAGQFMLRGSAKVNAEASILATCFNVARMITIVGISNLLVKLANA
jgi:transposase